MGRVLFRSVIATAMLLGPLVANQISAAEVSIADLVKAVPVLSIKNEQLSSFRLTFETTLLFKMPVVTQFVYSKPEMFGMVVSAGDERTPVWFLAQQKSLSFDASTRTAISGHKAGPQFVLSVDGDKLKWRSGITTKEKTDVSIDLPSLLLGAAENGMLDRDGAEWRVTWPSKSGKLTITAFFSSTEPFAIHKLESHSSPENSLLFSLRDISINSENLRWPDYPDVEAFPPGLKVVATADVKVDSAADGFGVVTHNLRSMAVQGGLRNLEYRRLPYLANVNWEEAEKANKELTPLLRDLFQIPAEPRGAVP